MNCPRGHGALIAATRSGVEIHECPTCAGLFLGPGTLDRIAAPHEGDLEFSTLDAESYAHEDGEGPADCPGCASQMLKVEFNIHTGIILDYCAGCRSFWLDGTELDRVNDEVRALDEASDAEVAPAMLWFAHFIWSLPR